MIYVKLFWSFFQIGLFTFGGGYAALPLIKAKIVDDLGFITIKEFADVVTISQMTPGPIGINAATFVGTRTAGLLGAITATAGCVTPSFIIVLILAYLYTKYNGLRIIQDILSYLRPAIVGMIATAGVSIIILSFWSGGTPADGIENINIFYVTLFAASFFAMIRWKVSPIIVILATGAAGLVSQFIRLV